jgi:hypothetical protein
MGTFRERVIGFGVHSCRTPFAPFGLTKPRTALARPQIERIVPATGQGKNVGVISLSANRVADQIIRKVPSSFCTRRIWLFFIWQPGFSGPH